jgi:hypothetical protein|tara:strand:+ start:966 stop:1526 length:561 start_codon:yes stop_codon:yes gene_type:complete
MNAIYWKTYKYFWVKDYPIRILSDFMEVIKSPWWFLKYTFYLNPRYKRYVSQTKADLKYLEVHKNEIEDLKEKKKEIYVQQYIRQLEATLNDDICFDLSVEMSREAMCFCYEGVTDEEYEDELYESIRNTSGYTDPKEIYGESIYDALDVWFKTESRLWNWADLHRKEQATQRKIKAWKEEVVYGC